MRGDGKAKLVTALWDLSAQGPAERRQYHRIGDGDGWWPSQVDGAVVVPSRARRDTVRAAERHASDLVEIPEEMSSSTPVTIITVHYRHGRKYDTTRASSTLGKVAPRPRTIVEVQS